MGMNKDSGLETPPTKDSGLETPPTKDSGLETPPTSNKDSGLETPPTKDSGLETSPTSDKDSGLETPSTSEVVERYYWKAVSFLVVLILVGSGFWGVRRFAPAVFLGKPDLIAVPNEERSHSQTPETLASSTPELLNINTASTKELQTLPNIGSQMAQRIVDYRKQHGRFDSVDALQNVKGIGAKTLEKLRPFVDAK